MIEQPTREQWGNPLTLTHEQASIALSLIAEPGDVVMGRMLENITPLVLLDTLWNEPHALHGTLAEAALDRWLPRLAQLVPALSRTIELIDKHNVTVLTRISENWPVEFRDLVYSAPFVLYARGDVTLLDAPKKVAIVGARATTTYGDHVAVTFTESLGRKGYVTVSGAAYGIDGMVHRTSLAVDAPTIAILAGGVDRFYPAGHDELIRRITQRGLVLSETVPGASPTKWRFLQRNRLIAALGHGTVVVEAGVRSGSLNTATHAMSIARPVMAVPGPITSAASAGCHRLIFEMGATLVDSPHRVDEIISER